MQTASSPIVRDIVLVGGGHSHVGVLRYFAMHPLPGVRLTVVCTDAHTPYSGMLPGYVAGHYTYDEVHIDLCRLCAAIGARFIQAEVTGLDRSARTVLLRDRPALRYDLVSINTGSTPQTQVAGAAAYSVPVKPITGFNQRWLALLARAPSHTETLRIAVVGGGAGGVELCLAMQHRLKQVVPATTALQFTLFTSGDLLPTHNPGVRRRFATVLAQRGVQVHTQTEVTEVQTDRLRTARGDWFEADEVLWVTQARGGAWLESTGLALDAQGCIRLNAQLQSITDPRVFAAGDVASIEHQPLEKAGVFAVRMGMPLARNLQRALQQQALIPYHPQRRWLALISTGDRYAIASRGALGFAGRWVWRWKDQIDRRFMRRFSAQGMPAISAMGAGKGNLSSTTPAALGLAADETAQAEAATRMRCGGCGAKVGASVLSRALRGLKVQPRPEVLLGLDQPDDAAVVQIPPGNALVQSVDFFRAFVDDPYVFGQIAANHALGDVFAMDATPWTATAIATVPPGLDAQVEATLHQMMAGAVRVLEAAGCTLVGGHSGEGAELALGFAVNGLTPINASGALTEVLRKGGMQVGDVLLLTKPLGTGALFAAHMQARAKGRWVQAALASMVQSNQQAATILRAHGATACTDVTGFGLLGHAVEMARPSGVQLQLKLDALPLLDGALDCVAQGLVSSLHSANARQRHVVRDPDMTTRHPRWPLLLDPQTAGGLLASVPAAQAEACIAALRAQGYAHACPIGVVLGHDDGDAPVHLL